MKGMLPKGKEEGILFIHSSNIYLTPTQHFVVGSWRDAAKNRCCRTSPGMPTEEPVTRNVL